MDKGTKQFAVFAGGLVAIILLATVLTLTVSPGAGTALSYGGTTLWVFGTLAYVVFIDSKQRWPEASAFTRFSYVITFKR